MSVKDLRFRRGQCAREMAELAENLTPESKIKFNALDTEQQNLAIEITKQEQRTAWTSSGREGAIGEPAESTEEQRYHGAWLNYLRHGLAPDSSGRSMGVNAEDRSILERRGRHTVAIEQRDMSEGIPTGGAYPGSTTGFFVPVGFVNKIEVALKFAGSMMQTSTIMRTATGAPLPFPTENDTTISGEIVNEGAQVSSADVSISQIMLSSYKFSTKLVKVSLELLQDSSFDLESFLVQTFGVRLGRILNNKFTLGGGPTNMAGSPLVASPEPTGIVPSSYVGVSSGTTPALIGNDQLTTPDPTSQVGWMDLVALEHSLDPLYRPGSAWMLHDTTLRYVKTIKDQFGRPLWSPGLIAGQPDLLMGYRYYANNDMAQLGAGNKTVLFGRLDKYLVRESRQMTVLRLVERYADQGLIGFLGFSRFEGVLLDAGTKPVRHILQHA